MCVYKMGSIKTLTKSTYTNLILFQIESVYNLIEQWTIQYRYSYCILLWVSLF